MGTKPGTKKENIDDTRCYAVSQISDYMTLTDFAEHISNHGSTYDQSDVEAILGKAVRCLREMLLSGYSVSLGEDFGSFRVTLRTRGAEKAEEFDENNIVGVNVVWNKGKAFSNLRKGAKFRLVASRLSQQLAKEEAQAQTTIVKKPVLS